MAAKLMVPARPPLPTPWNFPFQFATGNHTSKWITDTAVGFRIPCTSQNAGRFSMGRPCGGVNAPAGADLASVMVVLFSATPTMDSQVAASAADADHIGATTISES